MKTSIGYTISLNIVIVFIVVVFAFVFGMISYYKSYKINNIIVESIEKNEGYNEISQTEISQKLSSIGYNQSEINCGEVKVRGLKMGDKNVAVNNPANGYCVYYSVNKCLPEEELEYVGESDNDSLYCKEEEYTYIVKTYMRFNIPIIGQWLKIPVYSRTSALYACYGENC